MENPKSIFLRIFGDTPKLRVLDYLIINDDYDHSMKDIASNAGIGYTTLKQFWKQLLNEEVIKFVRDVGKAKMYTLNKENPAVKQVIKLYWTTARVYIRKKNVKKIVLKNKIKEY